MVKVNRKRIQSGLVRHNRRSGSWISTKCVMFVIVSVLICNAIYVYTAYDNEGGDVFKLFPWSSTTSADTKSTNGKIKYKNSYTNSMTTSATTGTATTRSGHLDNYKEDRSWETMKSRTDNVYQSVGQGVRDENEEKQVQSDENRNYEHVHVKDSDIEAASDAQDESEEEEEEGEQDKEEEEEEEEEQQQEEEEEEDKEEEPSKDEEQDQNGQDENTEENNQGQESHEENGKNEDETGETDGSKNEDGETNEEKDKEPDEKKEATEETGENEEEKEETQEVEDKKQQDASDKENPSPEQVQAPTDVEDSKAPIETYENTTSTALPKFNREHYDVCIIGAGLSGAVIAERYASQLEKTSLVLEKREHIGGNCYDYVDEDTGILMNKYGAHIFHTNYERVWEYVQQFSDWTPYEHRVLGKIGDKHVPIPVNIDTVNALYDLQINSTEEMDKWLDNEQTKYDHEPLNSEEMALSRVGPRLYKEIFEPYTVKQWAKHPKELGPEVTARIPVRNNHDDRYFGDKYQALPTKGYTAFFEKVLAHELIETHLNVDYFDVRDQLSCGYTYFTGPIDAYFAHLGYEKLEYRSLDFEKQVIRDIGDDKCHLPASVVNYPSAEYNFTRIVEYKHFLNQTSPHTVLFLERSKDGGEPYYPVPNKRNKNLYEKYRDMALKEANVTFVGRLANYKYFNMDQSIMNALELFDLDTNSTNVTSSNATSDVGDSAGNKEEQDDSTATNETKDDGKAEEDSKAEETKGNDGQADEKEGAEQAEKGNADTEVETKESTNEQQQEKDGSTEKEEKDTTGEATKEDSGKEEPTDGAKETQGDNTDTEVETKESTNEQQEEKDGSAEKEEKDTTVEEAAKEDSGKEEPTDGAKE